MSLLPVAAISGPGGPPVSAATPVTTVPSDSTAQRPLPVPASQMLHQSMQSFPTPSYPGDNTRREVLPGQSATSYQLPSSGTLPQGGYYYHQPSGATQKQMTPASGTPSEQQPMAAQQFPRFAGVPRGYPQIYLRQPAESGALQRPSAGIAMRPTGPVNNALLFSAPYSQIRAASSAPVPMLSQSLPPMANKAIAGSLSRPPLGFPRGGNPQMLKAAMPQMSRQAYLQQASAQLQNFQGGQLYSYQGTGIDQPPQPKSQPEAIPHQDGRMRPIMTPAYRPTFSTAQSCPLRPTTLNRPNNPGFASMPHIALSQQSRPRQMGLVGIPTAKRPVISQAEWNPVPLALQLASPHISLPPTATITVADRKVRLDSNEGATPMYVLLRRWFQNDPTLLNPSRQKLMIPRRSWPTIAQEASPPPKMLADPSRTRYGPEELLKSNKQHWLRVRRHHVSRQHRRLNQFRQRLAALIPDPALEVSSPKSIHKISRYSLAAQQPTNQGRNGTSNQAVGLGRNNELKAAEQSQSVRVSLNSNSNSLQGGSEPMVIEIDRSSASRSPPMSSMLVAEETILE